MPPWGQHITTSQGTRSNQFPSSIPAYPERSRNPLTKRLPILPQQDSLKRRTSITRVSPCKLVDTYYRLPPGKSTLKDPQPVLSSPKPVDKASTGTTSECSLAIRSGNSAMSEAGASYAQRSPEVKAKATPARKVGLLDSAGDGTGKKTPLSVGLKKYHGNTGKEKEKDDEQKFPPLRFSPEKPRTKNKLPPPTASPFRKTATENKPPVSEKKSTPARNDDIYAWRNAVARRKIRIASRSNKNLVYRSRIPVAMRDEPPKRSPPARYLDSGTPSRPAKVPTSQPSEETIQESTKKAAEEVVEEPIDEPVDDDVTVTENESSVSDHPEELEPDYAIGYDNHTPTPLHGSGETISDLRNQFLHALGIQEISLPSLSDHIANVNFNSVLKDKLREIKIQEMHQRISVVKLLHYSAKYHGANENELGCVKGWLDDLNEELWTIECDKMQPSKIWFDQIFRWLWHRPGSEDSDPDQFDAAPNEDLYVLYNAAPHRVLAAKKEHELFNLRDTGVELLRNGFRNKEKKMMEYWAKLRGLNYIPNPCGEDVIGIYMRRLTRWDGVELPETMIQRRRMWYFCLEHYVHWKEAVPFYALSVKMMNLLIVFHDLWGMHVDGMSNQEKKDFGVLHDNLYRFATVFIKPVEGANDPTWQDNECMYCFSKNAATRICNEERGRNIWMWLTQLAGIAGYGKYYAAVMKIMTDGKDPDYVNQLFETHFWSPRTCSLMTGLKRIKDAMKKHAGPGERMGLGIKKMGAFKHS